MPSPQMQAIAALCGFTGSDLTKFTSFCKTHSGPQLEETFLGRRIFFFLWFGMKVIQLHLAMVILFIFSSG